VDPQQCFEVAEKIELLMRDIYARLSTLHERNPRKQAMFRQLAEEEEQHAHRIRLLARHQGNDAWAQEAADRISRDLNGMAAELLQIVEELDAAREAPVPEELLRRVMDAESRCGSIHAEELARSAESDVRVLFHALAKQDVHHKELLETVAEP
jgi:rubrerythrin